MAYWKCVEETNWKKILKINLKGSSETLKNKGNQPKDTDIILSTII